jgi:hypothetical protein
MIFEKFSETASKPLVYDNLPALAIKNGDEAKEKKITYKIGYSTFSVIRWSQGEMYA